MVFVCRQVTKMINFSYFFLLFLFFTIFAEKLMKLCAKASGSPLTMSYFKLDRSNFETLSGLWPCIFGATIAKRIHASVALLVSKWVSIFESVLALQIQREGQKRWITKTLKKKWKIKPIIGSYLRRFRFIHF